MNLNIEAINSIDENHINITSSSSGSKKILNNPIFQFSFRKINHLCGSIKSHDIIRIKYSSGDSFMKSILPILLIGRFYSKKVILEYRNSDRFNTLESPTMIMMRILKLFHMILVDSEMLVKKLLYYKIKTSQLINSTNAVKSDFKIRSQIQPRILLDLSLNDNFNLHCVLEAYKLVKQKYPRTEIIITTADKMKLEHEYSINFSDYPGIIISCDEIQKLMNKTDIYLNCRFFEFLPSTIMDAFESGLPVITTPVGMIEKILNRDNVLLYNFNDHIALSDLIIELIEDPKLTEKLSNNGRKLSKEFSEVRISSYYQSLYNQLFSDN